MQLLLHGKPWDLAGQQNLEFTAGTAIHSYWVSGGVKQGSCRERTRSSPSLVSEPEFYFMLEAFKLR